MPSIYADHAATTLPSAVTFAGLISQLQELANPSSRHSHGQVDGLAAEVIALVVNADGDRVNGLATMCETE